MKPELTTDRPPLVDAYEQLVAASEENGGIDIQRGLADVRRRAVQAEPGSDGANVRASAPRHRKARETAHLPICIESDQIGTPKEELCVALTQFRVSCGNPAQPASLSIRTVSRISEDLTAHYQAPYDPPCRLYPLSASTISEVLSGKRLGLPSFDWVASYVLSCQRHAVGSRPGRRDQGTTILRPWADIYAAHVVDSVGGANAAFCLPQHQQDFVLTHGSYGETLLARAQRGHPHALYRVALLLASDPELSEGAVGLLIDVARTGHPLALDLQTVARRLTPQDPLAACHHGPWHNAPGTLPARLWPTEPTVRRTRSAALQRAAASQTPCSRSPGVGG